MNIIGMILVALAMALGLVSFFSVLGMFFPRRIAKVKKVLEEQPKRAFWVGLVNALFFTAILVGLFAIGQRVGGPILPVIGLIILLFPALSTVFGLAGLVQFAGERLAPERNELWRTGWGALAIGLASALPFLGWYAMLPFLIVMGLGAFVTSLFQKESPPEELASPEMTEI